MREEEVETTQIEKINVDELKETMWSKKEHPKRRKPSWRNESFPETAKYKILNLVKGDNNSCRLHFGRTQCGKGIKNYAIFIMKEDDPERYGVR